MLAVPFHFHVIYLVNYGFASGRLANPIKSFSSRFLGATGIERGNIVRLVRVIERQVVEHQHLECERRRRRCLHVHREQLIGNGKRQHQPSTTGDNDSNDA